MTPEAGGPWQAIRAGSDAVRGASPAMRSWLLACGLLLLLMLPFGRAQLAELRGRSEDAGGPLAPLSVDAGYLFRIRPAADFYSVYDAGTRALRGMDPYTVNDATGGPGLIVPYVATYRYLPITSYLLAVPLNVLPPYAAWVLWVAFGVVQIVANFLLCVGRAPHRIGLLALVWGAWFPLVPELHMGQFTLLMATCLLWFSDALFAGKRWATVPWATAVLLKVYPFAMAAPLWLWGRRTAVATVSALAIGTTVLWVAFVPSKLGEGLGARGVEGRTIAQSMVPYAGAQGTQAAVNAIVWKLEGRSMQPPAEFVPPARWRDPVFLANALVLAAFAALCLWSVWRSRAAVSLVTLGLLWLSWFVAYRDAWEHHFVLVQALLALLLSRDAIGPRATIAVWLCCGAPSLWWLWHRTGYAGAALPETIGLLYFVQRPLGLAVLVWALLRRRTSSEPKRTTPPNAESNRARNTA